MKGLTYEMGQVVYLVTDKEQLERIVIDALYYLSTGKWEYVLVCGLDTSKHVELEIAPHKNYKI